MVLFVVGAEGEEIKSFKELIKAEKRSSDQRLRWTERCANMFACAKGGYANIFVRYSKEDRTNAR